MYICTSLSADTDTHAEGLYLSATWMLLIGIRLHRCIFPFFKIAAENLRGWRHFLGKILYRYAMNDSFCSKILMGGEREKNRCSPPPSTNIQSQNDDVNCMTKSAAKWKIGSWYLSAGRPFSFHADSSKSLLSTTSKSQNRQLKIVTFCTKLHLQNPKGIQYSLLSALADTKKAFMKPNRSWENIDIIWKPQG